MRHEDTRSGSLGASSASTAWGALVWLHRWTGIAACLLFTLWFGSGIVMLYEPFPSLAASERFDRAVPFDTATVQISPAAVVAAIPEAQSLRLRLRDGKAAYLVHDGNQFVAVDAATGWKLPPIDAAAALRIARQFEGATAHAAELVEFDQWVVHEGFGAQRPYYRVEMADAADTVLYVSATTGEVRQRTTGVQRALNAVGAVPHWLYWTAIRKHWSLWDSMVWWLSLVALCSGTLGLAVGIWRFVQSKGRGGSGWKVFVSWWRWHHVLGLTAGVFLIGWIVSGWLSMDHGRLFSRSSVPPEIEERVRPAVLGTFANDMPLALLQSLGEVVEIELHTFHGNPFLVRRRGQAADIVTVSGETHPFLPDEWIESGVRAAFREEPHPVRVDLPEQDLYMRAEELPATARLFVLPGPPERRAYVDALTGELLAIQDPSRRAYAWVYYALHTYRFQSLVGRDGLRTILLLVPLLAGFALSVTGVVIGWRRVRKSIA